MINKSYLEKINLFIENSPQILKEILKEDSTYLVGGVVRDVIMSRNDKKDIDITTKNPKHIIKKYRNNIKTIVTLDDEFDVYRIFLNDNSDNYIDLSKIQGQDIIDDLFRRDYTINAIALRLNDNAVEILDPSQGIKDLEKKSIKKISLENLVNDPLRLLRAFRFKAELNFSIDSDTENDIIELWSLISNVAEERVKVELFKILNTEKAYSTFYELYKTGLLAKLFPFINDFKGFFSGKRHVFDLLEHSFNCMNIVEGFCNLEFPIEIDNQQLMKETEADAKISGLIKLAALFHDVGKLVSKKEINGKITYYEHEKLGSEFVKNVLQKKKFANDTINFISMLIRFHMYPFQIIQFGDIREEMTPRVYMKINKAFGDYAPLLFNFSIADTLATCNDIYSDKIIASVKKLYELYLNYAKKDKTLPLLNGKEIMDLLKIEEGPVVGKIILALREASLLGEVMSKEDAVSYIKLFYEKNC